MALDTFAPEYFLQELTPLEMFEFPWVALAGALSLSGPGNKLSWPDLEGSVTTASYTNNADVTYSAMSDKVYSVTVADFRATGFYVTDLERAQRLSNALANGMEQSMREQMVNLSTVIKTAYRTATRLAVSGLTEPIRGDDDGLTSNVTEGLIKHTGQNAADKWDTAGARLKLLGSVRRARTFGRRHGWPSRFACIAPLEVTEQINALLSEDKVNLGSGSMVDSAFATGMVPMVYGCEFHEDTLAEPINTGVAVGAASSPLRMDFHYPGQSVKYITQPIAVESMRDNDKFRQNGRTLRLNGAGQDAARFLYSEKWGLN